MQADSLNSRYEQNLERFIAGWQGEYDWHQPIDSELIVETRGLRTAMPPQVRPPPASPACMHAPLCFHVLPRRVVVSTAARGCKNMHLFVSRLD